MNDIRWCIDYLKAYNNIYQNIALPDNQAFRKLMNITMPIDLSNEFYRLQDKVLQKQLKEKTITDVDDLIPIDENIYLWQGDITTIKADGIVNACNSKLLGCFQPLHHCIDNAIHSFAGLQVRRDLIKIMKEQGHDEENGNAKITSAYNLPSKYILHTVGPITNGNPSKKDKEDLKNCYLSCMKLADEQNLKSIVFCSISTGLYGYPIQNASRVAVKTIQEYLKSNLNTSIQKVVFKTFTRSDYYVYYRTIKEMDQ